MRKLILTTSIIAAAIITPMIACNDTKGKSDSTTTVLDSTQRVLRGEYLVSIGGCDDCHSPKKMGPMGPEIIAELRLFEYNYLKNCVLIPVRFLNKINFICKMIFYLNYRMSK
jgi:hypothetical protein